jgi:hypothetical protein
VISRPLLTIIRHATILTPLVPQYPPPTPLQAPAAPETPRKTAKYPTKTPQNTHIESVPRLRLA